MLIAEASPDCYLTGEVPWAGHSKNCIYRPLLLLPSMLANKLTVKYTLLSSSVDCSGHLQFATLFLHPIFHYLKFLKDDLCLKIFAV